MIKGHPTSQIAVPRQVEALAAEASIVSEDPEAALDPAGRFARPGSSAPGGIRTPNLLIRSQVLYPLSYRRLRVRESIGALADASNATHWIRSQMLYPLSYERWVKPTV